MRNFMYAAASIAIVMAGPALAQGKGNGNGNGHQGQGPAHAGKADQQHAAGPVHAHVLVSVSEDVPPWLSAVNLPRFGDRLRTRTLHALRESQAVRAITG